MASATTCPGSTPSLHLKDELLHHLIDPLLDAIDACIRDDTTPAASARTAQQLLDAYLAVPIAHREVVPLVTTDVAVLNHPARHPVWVFRNRGCDREWSLTRVVGPNRAS